MPSREELPRPEGVFPTPFGDMAYKLNSADNVYIYSGDHETPPAIRVNGVEYRTSVHLYRQEDGSWNKDPKDYSQPYMSRPGHFGGKDASRAAMEKALKGISAAWEEFIFGSDLLLLEADRHKIVDEIIRVEEELTKKEAELSEIRARHAKLLQEDADLKEAYRRLGYKVSEDPEDWDPREPRRAP